MDFPRGLAAALDVDVGHHHPAFQRTRTVEGRGGDDVQKAVGFHLRQQVAHPAAFQLEDALGLASLQKGESLRVVERQRAGVDFDAVVLFHVPDCFVENCQVPEAQEVHLQQAGLLDGRAVPLRDDVLFARDRLQGDVTVQRFVGDDDTGCVRAGAAGEPLQPYRHVDHLPNLRILVVGFLQFGTLFERLLKGDVQRVGDHFADLVDPRQWN